MLRRATMIFGIILTLIGLAGFIPALTTTDNAGMELLLGIFMVSGLHNIIHLVTGVAALASAGTELAAKRYLQILGVVYAIITVVGFIQGDTVLGIIDVNLADNLLHLAISLFGLALGYGYATKSDRTATTV